MFRYLSALVITAILGLSIASSAGPATTVAMAASAAAHPTATKTPMPSTGSTVGTTAITGVARVSRLRVRDAASLKTKILFLLTRGQTVNILGVSETKYWFKIQTLDGKVGWVSIPYIRLVGGKLKQLAVVQ